MTRRTVRKLVSETLFKFRRWRGDIQGNRRLHHLRIRGESLWITDGLSSYAALIVAAELKKGCYALDEIEFSPGDVVIDIGAHVGLVSCYLAKRHPFLKIYAFEPFRENYENLILNLKNNGIGNVLPSNRAVTSDGRAFKMKVHPGNTGGATGQTRSVNDADHTCFEVLSTTLDRIFEENRVERCKLLKIDCEGSEHEILNACSVLSKVEHLRGEFHINEALRERGCSVEQLIDRCRREIPRENVRIQAITMAE